METKPLNRKKANVAAAVNIIRKYPNNIFYFAFMPNEEVIKLLIYSHIGLFSTYDDPYGYSILEAQVAGCPVITTNIKAIPEINNNEIGWLIDLPENSIDIGLIKTETERTKYSRIVREGLCAIIIDVAEKIEMIAIKGQNV
jgi:glycosyltransferase involved in cell wall biosynthesis